jgi:AcrR family transcriptional regulator
MTFLSPDNSIKQSIAKRILEVARQHLMHSGTVAMRMDDLSGELGMSKKTIYNYFESKDALIDAVIEELGRSIRERFEKVLSDPHLDSTEKLCLVLDEVGSRLSKISPSLLKDLRKNMPTVYRKIDELRSRNIPIVFARLIQQGIAEGLIKPDIDPIFAGQFWLQAIRGLLDPDVLERTQLTPKQTLEKSVHLFFNGLLTDAGNQKYRLQTEERRKRQNQGAELAPADQII